MDTIQAIKKRRSVRSYLDKPVPEKIITELVELANLAPTAANTQNRHFIVIRDKKTKQKLFDAGCKQTHLLEAPVVIAVATNARQFNPQMLLKKNKFWGMDIWGADLENYKNNQAFQTNMERWKNIWPIQDADAAITTLMLAAVVKGLSTCWLGMFDFQTVRNILKLPKDYEAVALITLGHEKDLPYPQQRKPAKELLHWEKW